ncbi:MAG: ribosome maturation factor RimM [Tatlockia sp.]|nr:ribosome maturation factor RimM [Tatlockia sp.]
MDNSTDWVIVGRFGRPHGIKGFITIHSFTEPRDNILRYSDWHVYVDNLWQPLKILHVESNVKSIIAQVEGYPEREQVATLANVEIAIRRTQLPSLDKGEYYWHQLVGMQVINQQGENFGKVIEILPTGTNDVLVVEGDKRHLIPYLLGQYIIDVDLGSNLIRVDWDMDF